MNLRKQIFAGVLAALLSLLAACSTQASLGLGEVVKPPLPPRETGTPEPTLEPTSPPGPIWDPAYGLEVSPPPLTDRGLELPLYGATGYATIHLGLWAEKPRPTPPPTPAPEPTPTPMPETPPPELPAPLPETPAPPPGDTPAEVDPSEPPPIETPSPVLQTPKPNLEPTEVPTITTAPLRAVSLVAEPASAITGAPAPKTALPTPTPNPFAGAMAVLPPGSAFTVLEESGRWWRVQSSAGVGWVDHTYCMINLPDVVPSLVYDATNSYDSRYTTSGRPLPGITGEGLYTGKVYNPRFEEEQYLMPVLYATAKRVAQAQQYALGEGNSLKLYEGYRPYAVQTAVLAEVSRLAAQDPEVEAGVSAPPWGVQWFISTGYSNHQRGYAIDVSLVKVAAVSTLERSGHTYLKVEQYEEYAMPTPIHELSIAAATFTEPVPVYSQTAWKKAVLAPGMNDPALGLQGYCAQAGLTPLSSEWWHFNDVNAYTQIQYNQGVGGFEIKNCVSLVP